MQTVSSLYAYHLQNEEPSFYTRIPHILSHLTYDYIDPETKEKITLKLSVHARELYRVIKMTAGDTGKCWKNHETLADECNMSKGMVANAKWELMQPMHQLDGNPLIKIEECQKSTVKDGKQKNKTIYHNVTVINIWKWNNAFQATKRFHLPENIPNPETPLRIESQDEARSPHDRAEQARSPHDHAPQEARSPHDRNKNTSINNPLSKDKQPAADAAIAVSSTKKKRCFSCEGSEQAYKWLLEKGCNEKTSFNIATSYSPEDIASASKYTVERSKKIPVDKYIAYFHDTLKNRYWERKK